MFGAFGSKPEGYTGYDGLRFRVLVLNGCTLRGRNSGTTPTQ